MQSKNHLARAIREGDAIVLDGALQIHVAFIEAGDITVFHLQAAHAEIPEALKLAAVLAPPRAGIAGLVGVDKRLVSAPTGLAHPLLLGLTEIDPAENVAGEVFFP